MNESYWIIRGIAPETLFRTSLPPDRISEIIRKNAQKMKQIAQELIRSGVPLRYVLCPYIDTVLLDERTPAFFFGGRMLLFGAPTAAAIQTVQAEGYRIALAPDAASLRTRLRIRCSRPDMALITELPNTASFPIQLVRYQFPAGQLDPAKNAMQLRAQSRAVLAFGDILGRVIAKAGGEILCCAEDELICAWHETEPKTIADTIQMTYASQLMPVLGGSDRMRRSVYGGVQ